MWLASDNIAQNYSLAVDNALNDEFAFSTFKSTPSYNAVVGMSTLWQAERWYTHFKNSRPDIVDNIKKYTANDSIGSPQMYITDRGVSISPNTLRYVNTAVEIEEFFKFDRKISVCELGVGYGGLCYIMNQHFDIESYCLLDLPNVQRLATKYLNRLEINNTYTGYVEWNDLFISEFCLSEFDDTGLYEFYEKYVVHSKNIYLHMNLHEETRKSRFLQTLGLDFHYEVCDEFPKTQWPNYVVKGTRK